MRYRARYLDKDSREARLAAQGGDISTANEIARRLGPVGLGHPTVNHGRCFYRIVHSGRVQQTVHVRARSARRSQQRRSTLR